MKTKLSTVALIILGVIRVSVAAEVINVDLNGNNDYRGYVGNGAYDVGDDAVWTVYYGGWGRPVGSKRTESLVGSGIPVNQQFYSSTYAAQVWIGDNGQNHGYQWGDALMDDGFVRTAGEPNLALFGEGAYQGVYDIYVYGSAAGSFKLNYYGNVTTKTLTGNAAPGQFELGKNYVVFDNVNINTGNSDNIYIAYTNIINGLQLVKQKDPCVIEPNALGMDKIAAGDWDIAGERNLRTEAGEQRQSPDTYFDVNDANMIGSGVAFLDTPEFMEYDINVPEASEGRYEISIALRGGGRIDPSSMKIYLDDKFIGEVNLTPAAPAGTVGETTRVTTNLYEGPYTVRWYLYAGNTGANLYYLKFYKVGNILIDDCGDIVLDGLTLTKDLNGDCIVDLRDLKMAVEDWTLCNNPYTSSCF